MGLYYAFGWACSRKLLRTIWEAEVKVLISYRAASKHFKTLTFASHIWFLRKVVFSLWVAYICTHMYSY